MNFSKTNPRETNTYIGCLLFFLENIFFLSCQYFCHLKLPSLNILISRYPNLGESNLPRQIIRGKVTRDREEDCCNNKKCSKLDYNIYFFAVCYNSYVGKLCMILSQYLGKAQLPACHMSLLTKL